MSDKFNRIAREAENSSSHKKNKKKTKKIKRKKNRTGKKRKASLNKGKKQKVNKSKPQKKGGGKKKEKRNIRMKKRGKKKKERRNKRMKKGGKKKKERKRNKNGKVSQKGNKKGGKKKNVRDMRNRRKNSRKTRKNRSSSLANCYRQTVFMMKIWKDVVSNFQKQNARMKSQKSIGERKTGKKGLFAPTAFKLIDIGGGNRSNLSCGGTYGSNGAKQLGNLTKTLFDCELSVNTSCNPANFPKPNTTFIEACETGTTSFVTQVYNLHNLTETSV